MKISRIEENKKVREEHAHIEKEKDSGQSKLVAVFFCKGTENAV